MTTKPLILRSISILAVTATGLMLAACQQAPPVVVAAPADHPDHGERRDRDQRVEHEQRVEHHDDDRRDDNQRR
jgi:hypothetical protein